MLFLTSLLLRASAFLCICSSGSSAAAAFFSSKLGSTWHFNYSNRSLFRITIQGQQLNVAYFDCVMKVKCWIIYNQYAQAYLSGKRKLSMHLFLYQCTSFRNAGSLTCQTNRNIHLDFSFFTYAKEVNVGRSFTYRVKLYFLKNRLALSPSC